MKTTNKMVKIILFCLFLIGNLIAQEDGEIESRNYFRDIGAAAKSLSRFEPKPQWETMVKADQADFIELIGENHLLVGTIQLSVNVGQSDYSDIYLFDRQSGKELWRSDRKPLRNGSYALLTDTPLIILQGHGLESSYYTAYDPRTGVIVWDYEVDDRHNVQFCESDFSVIICSANSSELNLSKLNLLDGEIAWEQSFRVSLEQGLTAQSLLINGNNLYVAFENIRKLDLKSGSVIWSSQNLTTEWALSLVKDKTGIVAWSNKSVYLLEESKGSLVWGPTISEHIFVTINALSGSENIFYAICNKLLYEYQGRNIYKNIIAGIDPETGKIIWIHEPEDNIQSVPCYIEDNIYFTTYNTLNVLDSKSGNSVLNIELPIKATATKNLPDVLIPVQRSLYIIKEMACIASYSVTKKQVEWHQNYYENIYHSWFWYSMRTNLLKKYEQRIESSEEARDNEIAWWQGWNRTVNVQWNADGDLSGTGNNLTRFGRHMSLFQTSLAFSSILQATILKDVLDGIVSRLRLGVVNASRLHLRSIQGDYYVRPYDKQGEGVLIVDLNTGKRCDLEYAAPNKGMKLFTMRLPQFTIDPRTNTLYSFGISTNSKTYEKYVKIKVGMPYPSLQAFDLSNLAYDDIVKNDIMMAIAGKKGENDKIQQYLAKGISIDSRTGEGKTALYLAALKGHLHTVKFLTEQGADLEAEDYNGKTALFIACEKGHTDIVRVLIESGANVNARDKYDTTILTRLKGGKKKDIIEILENAGAK